MTCKNGEYCSIAIDGPAGAGKSTIAKKVAEKLAYEYIDTGAMYRALTLKILDLEINPTDTSKVLEVLSNTKIDFQNNNIYLDSKDVNKRIRENKISQNVSYIAAIPEVRNKMLILQQNLANSKNIVMDGRDICTVVLPNSKYKFFITASANIRAKRRYEELSEDDKRNTSVEEIEREIIKRDEIDSNREVAPLIRKEDTILIDNTVNTIDESVDLIISEVKRGKI